MLGLQARRQEGDFGGLAKNCDGSSSDIITLDCFEGPYIQLDVFRGDHADPGAAAHNQILSCTFVWDE